ncbi:MAG: M16 family metallopeptidase [bacterium]
MKTIKKSISGLLLSMALLSTVLAASKLPEHPSELKFTADKINIPERSQYRHELESGAIAYIVEDHSLPLVSVSLLSRGGEYELDKGQAGLSGMTASLMRDGGAGKLSPSELDERLDFLASSVSISIGETSSSASLSSISRNFDETFKIYSSILLQPKFDPERLAIAKNRTLEYMRKRNDDTRRIEPRFWSRLSYGDEDYTNQLATEKSINDISRSAMMKYSKQVFSRNGLVFAVSGDVDTKDIIKRLNKLVSKLPKGKHDKQIPSEFSGFKPGLYGVNKEDVNQTRVRIGHRAVRRGNPDEMALKVMNNILGGGGFTSRIVSRVRSDEGLAYSAGSRFGFGVYRDGMFRAFFQSKNRSVPQATGIVLEEIERIRTKPVTANELDIAKNSYIGRLREVFASPTAWASRFASDELTGLNHQYWLDYAAKIEAVTAEDVQRVARQYLHPDQLKILVVGQLGEATVGDEEHPSLEDITGLKLKELPLRDPMTLEVAE